jgi:hypothetical protein
MNTAKEGDPEEEVAGVEDSIPDQTPERATSAARLVIFVPTVLNYSRATTSGTQDLQSIFPPLLLPVLPMFATKTCPTTCTPRQQTAARCL